MTSPFLGPAEQAREALAGARAPADGFARHLQERFGDISALEALNLPDLFLAWAALERDAAALKELDRRLKSCVRGIAADQDVLQAARAELLVGDGHAPKLRAYSGRGALIKWLRVVLVSRSIDAKRKVKGDEVEGDAVLLARASDAPGSETLLISAQHKRALTEAFTQALAALTVQERTVLRMRFVDQVQLEEIGRAFNVHRTTVMRWLEQAFERLMVETRGALAVKLKLPAAELDSLVGALRPSLSERLSRLLKPLKEGSAP